MELTGDTIAEIVQKQFDQLPEKRKPQARGDGVWEWVPLSGVVAERGGIPECVALGTGMKCLPQNKISQAQGVILHDCHAEIVALRSFNRFLLEECKALALSQKQRSEYLYRRSASDITKSHFQPFSFKKDVTLHMYSSEAPCGDASMELTIAAQDDATPWPSPSSAQRPSPEPGITLPEGSLLQGRGYFSQLGTVRRKPSRPDAPPTVSKSCSDKLAHKQCTSLLSSPVSLLISPENLYLQSLTLPESQHSPSGCERAFSETGRMAPLAGRMWEASGYQFHPFQIRTTTAEFQFSRRCASGSGLGHNPKLVPSNITAAWIPRGEETLIGGMLQGRKQFDPKGASMLCKKSMWRLIFDIAAMLAVPAISQVLNLASYELVKNSDLLEERRKVKQEVRKRALQGWINNGGDDFGLNVINE